jgi:hypothetical protein
MAERLAVNELIKRHLQFLSHAPEPILAGVSGKVRLSPYFEFFSNAVWQGKQYLQAIAFRRLSGIGSPHSSQSIADSPVYIDFRVSSIKSVVICSIRSMMASVPPAHADDIFLTRLVGYGI